MCSARLVARAGLVLALGGTSPGCTAPAPGRDAAAARRSAAACPWPDSLDAVRAAPRNHRVVLENDEVRTAAPDSVFPMTLWLPPQAPHAVENLDARPVRLLRVEFKL
jgi:hypothetical protein